MTIALPSEKISGATVLRDELFGQFGTRTMRPISLHRSRGDIAHFRLPNLAWTFSPDLSMRL